MEALKRTRKEENTRVVAAAFEAKTAHIPGEILHDIFVRLPAKTLLRFKAVCKAWRDLITDSQFLKSQFKLANKIEQDNVNYLHMSIGHRLENNTSFHTSTDRSLALTSINSETSEIKTVNLNYSFHPHQLDSIVLGSCNGLLLLGISYETFLWNPSTGEHRILLNNNCWIRYRDAYHISGLGYDSSRDEYKAVIFVGCHDDDDENDTDDIDIVDIYRGNDHLIFTKSQMFIFSSRTGYWKEGDCAHILPLAIYRSNWLGLTVNGFPHWVVNTSINHSSSYTSIIYFDMVDEQFKWLQYPTASCWNYTSTSSMSVLGGCLCTVHNNEVYYSGFDVWVMKEHGVQESWTKLFNIRLRAWTLTPLGFTNNGDEVVLQINKGELVTYNIKTNTTKSAIVSMENKFRFNEAAMYVESLVSPWDI